MILTVRFRLVIVLASAAVPVAGAEIAPSSETVTASFFETKVRPILADHCYACHSAETKPAGGLRVDDRNGLLVGGNTGPAVVPGDPEGSLLLQRVRHENPRRKMPREGEPLSSDQIRDLARWIRGGAPWPATKVPASLGQAKPWYESLRKEHWAWQPIAEPAIPVVRDTAWPRDALDRFVLARLEAAGLKPARDARKLELLRRVSFDLSGLPPSPAEISAFLEDASPTAFERVVDRLLASPAFGERWGRHWLDVARYAESTGPSRNVPYPHAWRYRDYVIDAVNADVPFDRFVTEQVAGDLLAAANPKERDRLATATGFLALGVKDVNQRFKVRFTMDNVDDQIDVVTRSVLALTVSCARCHDHKFDPIPTTDYYALAGIFTSTDNCAGLRNRMGGGGLDYYDPSMLLALSEAPSPPPRAQVRELEEKVAEAQKAWEAIRGTPEGLKKAANGQPAQRPFRLKYERLRAELLALTDPGSRGFAVHGVRDAKIVNDTEVRLRGQAEQLGPTVARGFLTAFDVPGAPAVNPRQSGRRELAQWLTSPRNPLTPRVIVNRVWQHLFGRGIVASVDNFGSTGDLPSHPELLDHLAQRFIRAGWSTKRLVRAIVLSRAYRLSADASPAELSLDPANILIWRHTPRRLEAEELRDAMLAAAGTLKTSRSRPTGTPALKMTEIRDNGPEARAVHEEADASLNRSVYLPLLRGLTPHALEVFDPVEQTLVTGRRETTTVPSQALYLLNSPFVRQRSLELAEHLLTRQQATNADRVQELWQRVLGRFAYAHEVQEALEFLTTYQASPFETIANRRPEPAAIKARATRRKPEPANPDEVDQTGEAIVETVVLAKDARTAAWLALVQSVLGSAQFRYIR
jgi:hypothetical protein